MLYTVYFGNLIINVFKEFVGITLDAALLRGLHQTLHSTLHAQALQLNNRAAYNIQPH